MKILLFWIVVFVVMYFYVTSAPKIRNLKIGDLFVDAKHGDTEIELLEFTHDKYMVRYRYVKISNNPVVNSSIWSIPTSQLFLFYRKKN